MIPPIFKVIMILFTVVIFYLLVYPLYYSLRVGKEKQKLSSFTLGIKYFVFNILVWCSFAGLQGMYLNHSSRFYPGVTILLCLLPYLAMYSVNLFMRKECRERIR